MLLPCKKDIAELLGKNVEDIKVGYASSIADLFHAGHVAYLRAAKNMCDYLIVGIVNDPTLDRNWKNKPVQSLFERYIQVASCVYADCVIPLSGEQDLKDSLLLLQPDVRFVGEEYRGQSFTGSDIDGIEIVYLPRRHSFSSTDLRSRVYAAEKSKQAADPKVVYTGVLFPERYQFEDDIKDLGKEEIEDAWEKAITVAESDCLSDVGKQDY